MRTRSQGPPVSPNIERDEGPFPNPEQVARDQAEAIRLAGLAAQGGGGLVHNVFGNNNSVELEQGEIPPVNTGSQATDINPRNIGENSPVTNNQREGPIQERNTGEIPPSQPGEGEEEGAVGGAIQVQGTPKTQQR